MPKLNNSNATFWAIFKHSKKCKMRLLVFFPVFEFHSRSETLRFKSSQSQLCFVHSSQFSTLEVSGGQIGFFSSMIDFAGEMAGNCFPPCRSGSNWWIKPKKLPKTMPPWQISTARTSHKGAITSLKTCSACTKRWATSNSQSIELF